MMATKKKKREVKYPKIGATLFTKDSRQGALTIEKAKEIIGWWTEEDASKEAGEEVKFGKDFVLRDRNKNKVQLLNNSTNRPFRMTLANRWGNEVLRNKWQFNGEPIIIDRLGDVQDGQHRLVGLILADQDRLADREYWQEEYSIRGPLSIETIVNHGISEKPEVVDSIDTGQKRSLGDVLFRGNVDYGKDFTEAETKRIANVLGVATRLCWLRMGGQNVSDAPHFPHSEAMQFLKEHPRLVESVTFVFNEDKGDKEISTYISLGYAAALHYLTATAKTDPDKFETDGESSIKYSLWDRADEFWVYFKNAEKGLGVVKTSLQRIQSGGIGRDEKVGVLVNAINLFLDGKTVKASKDVKVPKGKKDGRPYLKEEPRLGGLDVLREAPEEPEEVEEPEEKTPAKKDSKSSKSKKPREYASWEVGEVVWVQDEDGTVWKGKIEDLVPVQKAIVLMDGTEDESYKVSLSQLSRTKPKS